MTNNLLEKFKTNDDNENNESNSYHLKYFFKVLRFVHV